MALAIYRDLLVTNGERLSPATKALFEEAADSQFFYHVRGPDGGFITGYSPPPLRPLDRDLTLNTPTLFTSIHRGQPVQVVQLMEKARIDGLEGSGAGLSLAGLTAETGTGSRTCYSKRPDSPFTDQHGLPCRCLWNQNWPEAPFFG